MKTFFIFLLLSFTSLIALGGEPKLELVCHSDFAYDEPESDDFIAPPYRIKLVNEGNHYKVEIANFKNSLKNRPLLRNLKGTYKSVTAVNIFNQEFIDTIKSTNSVKYIEDNDNLEWYFPSPARNTLEVTFKSSECESKTNTKLFWCSSKEASFDVRQITRETAYSKEEFLQLVLVVENATVLFAIKTYEFSLSKCY